MDELVAWLRGALDEIERVATAAQPPGVWYRVFRTVRGEHEVVLTEDGQMPEHIDDEDVMWVHTRADSAHIALHDPRSVLARVEAERAILSEHELVGASGYGDSTVGCRSCDEDEVGGICPRGEPGDHCPTIRWLAYGHRFDAEGWREEWAPAVQAQSSAP